MRTVVLQMVAASRDTSPPRDPSLDARAPTGWRRWLGELGHHEPGRVAESGAILFGGFLIAIALLYGFGWLTDAVFDQQTQALDLGTLAALQRVSSPQLALAAQAISAMGSQVVLILGALLLVLFLYQRRWGAAAMLLLVAAGAQGLDDVLKEVFHRARPTLVGGMTGADQFSFPSGHATLAAAFYLYLAYLTWHLVRGRWRGVLVAVLIALVLLIGLARLYLELHYLSDVVAGYLAGSLWTDVVILASRALAWRSSRWHAT